MQNNIILGVDLDDTCIRTSIKHSNDCIPRVKVHVIPSAIKYLPLIQHELGCTLHLITARPSDYMSMEEVKMLVFRIEREAGVKFDAIRHTDYAPKGYDAAQLNCNFMIDDCVEYLATCWRQKPAPVPILFGKNDKKAKRLDFECVGCQSWKEVYDYLKEYKINNVFKF